MATRKPYQDVSRPKTPRLPRAGKAPAVAKLEPGVHSIEWFQIQLAGILHVLAECVGSNFEDVVEEISKSAIRDYNLDAENLEVFVKLTIEDEKEARRRLILSAAAKLTDAELQALNIGPGARSIIAGDDSGEYPFEEEDEDCDD